MRLDYYKPTLKLILSLIVLIFVLSGCGGKGKMSVMTPETKPVEKTISPTGYNHFVNANLLEMFGVYPEAIREYENALDYFPESVTIRTDYARLLFRLSQIPEALKQANLIKPRTSEVHLLLGDCYRLLDDMPQAVEQYRNAVKLDPDNVNAYWYLAGYYRQKEQADSVIAAYYQLARLLETERIWHELATWLSDAGRYEEAEEAFKKVLEAGADGEGKSRTWFEMALMMAKAERYGDALDAFYKSIEYDSTKENIESYLGLATTYDILDSVSRSEDIYKKVIEMVPNDVRVYRHMLSMYLARQDLKKSIEVSQDLVALVPSDWVAQRRLGILLYSDGQLDRADSLFSSRIEFGDDNVFNYFYRGRVAIEQERIDDARPFFETATEKEPSFVDSWLNLGFVLSQQDSIGNAIDTYREGYLHSSNHEDSTRLTFALGAALERNGQFHEAVNTFKDLISREKDHAPALNYLGYMLADRGEELAYALELINRALELSPGNGAYIDSYAWVQYKLGNYDLALTELKKAADLLDNDAVVYEHLGDVYKAMGDVGEAERHYRRALEIDPDSVIIEEKLKE